jgi:type IV pilus assembly protein PilB
MKLLEEELVDEGFITVKQLQTIYQQMSVQKDSLIKVLIKNSYIDELNLALLIAKKGDIPFIEIANRKTDRLIINILPEKIIRKKMIFPMFKVLDSLTLAMLDPLDKETIEEVRSYTNLRVEPVVSTYSDLEYVISKWFGVNSAINDLINNYQTPQIDISFLEDNAIFKEKEDLGPINKLAHLIVTTAIRENASDIHMESKETGMDVRFRLDGVLHKKWSLPLNLSRPLISSIKILAKMDIVEKRLPLDGSFRIYAEQRLIDVRVSSYPMLYGEKLVLRLLDQDSMVFDLAKLGMDYNLNMKIRDIIRNNYGIFLVSGPTGSGKTTTLYSILNEIKSLDKNIVTIEDPVEYHIDLINQSEINPKCGLTFAHGLRSVLRQDPDIILIGEIRDKETAEIAFQAALTGHLVLSTLHTNDTASSVARLIDIGIEPYLISSVLLGVLSQRLVRKVCTKCQDLYVPEQDILYWAGLDLDTMFLKGKGCNACRNTGYKGRTGLFELLLLDDQIKKMINFSQISEPEIRSFQKEVGINFLKDDGIEKVKQQITTIEEVNRVVR